jgi:hypothetical protein
MSPGCTADHVDWPIGLRGAAWRFFAGRTTALGHEEEEIENPNGNKTPLCAVTTDGQKGQRSDAGGNEAANFRAGAVVP